jgi:hypothetical protein
MGDEDNGAFWAVGYDLQIGPLEEGIGPAGGEPGEDGIGNAVLDELEAGGQVVRVEQAMAERKEANSCQRSRPGWDMALAQAALAAFLAFRYLVKWP